MAVGIAVGVIASITSLIVVAVICVKCRQTKGVIRSFFTDSACFFTITSANIIKLNVGMHHAKNSRNKKSS